MRKTAFLLLLVLPVLGFAETNRWLFIEYSRLKTGRVTHQPEGPNAGLDYLGPHVAVDFPTYAFDQAHRCLSGKMDFTEKQVGRAIFGSSYRISGIAGFGEASRLYNVTNLPFSYGSAGGKTWFTLESIHADGTILAEQEGQRLRLEPMQSVTNTVVSTAEDRGYGLEFSEITTVRNHGWLEETNILWNQTRKFFPPPRKGSEEIEVKVTISQQPPAGDALKAAPEE